MVVSDAEKAQARRQVWVEKANASKPLMRRRNDLDGIETRVPQMLWDEPGGCLFIGLVVSGVKVARARSRLQHGTWELLASGLEVRGADCPVVVMKLL